MGNEVAEDISSLDGWLPASVGSLREGESQRRTPTFYVSVCPLGHNVWCP